jgi:hypothetical protein
LVRALAVVAVAALLSGCDEQPGPLHEPPPHVSPTDAGQPEYVFAGCANADGPLCPRSQTLVCAVELIRKGGDGTCIADEDCALVDLKRDCVGLCGPIAVGDENREEVQARLQAQVDRYCQAGSCSEVGCDAGTTTTWVPVCHVSFCERFPADAGAADAG